VRTHREKDGKKLKLLYRPRSKAAPPEDPGNRQAGLPEGGIDVELKSVVASVFFSSDVANPTLMPSSTRPRDVPDPDESAGSSQLMRRFHSRYVATKETSGRALISRAGPQGLRCGGPMRPRPNRSREARALYIKANDIMMQDTVFIR